MNKDNSAFITSVLPTGDQYQKKEIVAIIDNEEIKKGFFGQGVRPKDVLLKFKQWGANPEDINKMSDFLNANLTKETVKEREISVETNVNESGVQGKIIKKKKY